MTNRGLRNTVAAAALVAGTYAGVSAASHEVAPGTEFATIHFGETSIPLNEQRLAQAVLAVGNFALAGVAVAVTDKQARTE